MAAISPKTYVVLGWGLLFIGALMILFGLGLEYLGSLEGRGALGVLFGSLGIGLCGIGGASSFTGVGSAWQEYRRHNRLRKNPEAFWWGDFAWDEKSSADINVGRARQATLWTAIGLCCGLPLLGLSLFSSLHLLIKLLCFGLGAVALVATWRPARHGIEMWRRALNFGPCRLHFRRFPFFVNDDFQASLKSGWKGEVEVEKLTATVRCLEERELRHRFLGRTFAVRQVWEVYRETRTLDTQCLKDLDKEGLNLSFFLPGEAPSTALSRRLPRYWQLHIQGQTPTRPLDVEFLIPIYGAAPEE